MVSWTVAVSPATSVPKRVLTEISISRLIISRSRSNGWPGTISRPQRSTIFPIEALIVSTMPISRVTWKAG